MWKKIKEWFGPVADSIKGKINLTEFWRVIITAVLTALTTGGLAEALLYFQNNIGLFFPEYNAPEYATLAFIITAILDFIRRTYIHGQQKVKDQTAIK